jgi:hypothetical protein
MGKGENAETLKKIPLKKLLKGGFFNLWYCRKGM